MKELERGSEENGKINGKKTGRVRVGQRIAERKIKIRNQRQRIVVRMIMDASQK